MQMRLGEITARSVDKRAHGLGSQRSRAPLQRSLKSLGAAAAPSAAGATGGGVPSPPGVGSLPYGSVSSPLSYGFTAVMLGMEVAQLNHL
jgi:hypothetical protein